MKLPNFSGLTKVAGIGKAFVMANRPELLFGASVVTTLTAVGLAGKGGYEAGQKVLRAEYSDLDLVDPEGKSQHLTATEKAALTWKCYTPAALTTLGALGSTTGLHLVHVKEKKALATAGLAALNEVREEAKKYVDDVLGIVDENVTDEETKEKIQNGLYEKAADENGVARVISSGGEVQDMYLVRDPFTGRDFWTTKVKVEEAIAEVGNIINGQDCASLNDFYDEMGWPKIPTGETHGWGGVLPMVKWLNDWQDPIAGVREDGKPFRSFVFQPEPQTGYSDPHR